MSNLRLGTLIISLCTSVCVLFLGGEEKIATSDLELRLGWHSNVIALSQPESTNELYCGVAYLAGAPEESPHPKGGAVMRWDLEKRERLAIRYLTAWPSCMMYLGDVDRIIVGCGRIKRPLLLSDRNEAPDYLPSGQLALLDAKDLKTVVAKDLKFGIYGVALSPDRSTVAVIGAQGKEDIIVQLRSLDTLNEIEEWKFRGTSLHTLGPGALRPICFSSDGMYLLASVIGSGLQQISINRPSGTDAVFVNNEPGKIVVIDLKGRHIHDELLFERGPISYLKLSSNDRKLYYISDNCAYMAKVSDEKSQVSEQTLIFGPAGGIERIAGTDQIVGVYSRALGPEPNILKAGLFDVSPARDAGAFDNGPLSSIMRVARFECSQDRNPHPDYEDVPVYGLHHSFLVTRDHSRLIVGDQNGVVSVWKIPR